MNSIDDILERLKGQQPTISDPDQLTDRIMHRLGDLEPEVQHRPARVVSLRRRWIAAAACLLLIIGIGTTLLQKEETKKPEAMVAKAETAAVEVPVVAEVEVAEEQHTAENIQSTAKVTRRVEEKASEAEVPETSCVEPAEEPNLLYASHELTQDTLPYQDPARVDEFIAKLAAFNHVEQGELQCSQPVDSSMVSSVYVFPDKEEINVFGRLLQVACWYSDETPGYFLSFSHQQFFFELKDLRKELQYRWVAERVNGKILLYGTCAPIGANVSSACYQEFRDELMHTKSIHSKPKEI